ncbi:MAG: ABC transporter ATP-binding protein, partial [Nitrospirota bacterium]|nr:ABC transporter ATP-binding protein [Nitrospirota bacterium]
MSTDKPVLELKNLKVRIPVKNGQARPVDGISFKIASGKTLALVGESGCGKTMTALSLIQLLPPGAFMESGEILINGDDFAAMDERHKRDMRGSRVSMIFQEPMTSLNPVFTVGEQISEVTRLHQNLSRAEARSAAVKMISDVGLPDPERLYGQYPHTLSGGQRQRIMIAIALACRPGLLIADEPTTALDVTIQAEILDLLNDLKATFNSAVLL